MFNFDLFFFLITILFLLFCSFLDIKYRSVSNKIISYFLIISILAKLTQSIYFLDFSYILNSLFCFLISFVILFLFWEFGIIAGADLKILLVVSILNPLNLGFLSKDLFLISKTIFPLTLLIISFLILAPYVFIYSLSIIIFKKPKLLLKNLINLSTFLNIIISTISIYLISNNTFIFNLFNNSQFNYLYLIFNLLLFFLFSKLLNLYKYIFSKIIISLFIILFIVDLFLFKIINFNLKDFLLLFIFILLINIIQKIYYIIKNNVLIEPKLINNLKEGDLLYYNYYKKGNKLHFEKITFFKQIKLLLTNKYYSNLKIDSNKSGGLNSKDIRFLKTMYKNNLLNKYILVKKTIPFIPAILIAYVLLNILGDFIWLILI